MRALGVCALLLALAGCQGYNSFRSSYSSSSSSSFGSGGSGGVGQSQALIQGQAQLNSWAYNHLNEVREFANRLTQEYNAMSTGSRNIMGHSLPWSASIQQLSGKSASELDALCLQISQKLVNDMHQGLLSYNNIVQPAFFDSKAAEVLENYATGSTQQIVELSPFKAVDLSGFDEVKNYEYPAEVKVIDGKTYLVHRNCTEATKISNSYAGNANAQLTHGYYPQNPITSLPSSRATTLSRQSSSLQDWIGQRMEPTVVDYRSVVSIDNSRPLPTYSQITAMPSFGQPSSPGSRSTVTVRRFNKTITTHPDGTSSVDGSEAHQRWENGQLVYDNNRPFGQSSVPRDEQWKREEREHFFWYLTTPQRLEDWQHQHEDRLLAVAHRYHTTLPVLLEFHRRELSRYQALLAQYQAQVQDATAWQQRERGRLDWLIHQNSFTAQDFDRWQMENSAKLRQLAQSNGVSLEQLLQWQRQELQRLHVYFNKVNDSLSPQVPQIPNQISIHESSSLIEDNAQEQQRLNELIRQHNATIAKLQSSILSDQQRLKDLSIKYQGDMQSQTQWLRGEVARIGDLIKEQNEQVTRLSAWQSSERARLESMLKQHRGSLSELRQQMAQDRSYVQNLAAKYRVGVDELEKWQREELQRLQLAGQQQLESHIKDWQSGVSAQLRNIIGQNQLTIEEFQNSIINDRARLEQFARTYKVRVEEIESWIKSELKKFQSEGLLKEVEEQLASWQQRERERLQALVQHNSLTVEQLEAKIKSDQAHFFELANTYQVRVEDIQDWLKKELLRLQAEGLIKAEALKDWQLAERQQIAKLVQQNKYSIDEFERKLLADRARLNDLSKTYNVKVSEIEQWIQSEGERLQREGQLHMETQLNNWQKIERQRLLDLINKNNLSIEELEMKIGKDQTHLYSLAQQNQVRVEEIEQWIKQQIQKLQNEGLIEMQRLKNWQLEWRGNLTNMVQERDYTVEEFHKWLLEDRARLQNLAMQHNVQIEEIEQFVKKEEQRFIGMGLLKPSEKLTNWQEVERLHLKNLAQQQYKSTEQLEARLRQDRELLEKLATQYSVQVEEIENWMKQELARMRDEGKLQIDNLTSWQLAERERLEALLKQNKQWSAEELQAELANDREHMQTMAFQYHTSVEEIERWVQSEIERLKQQGKLNIEQMTAWQQAEHQRILSLLQSQSNITMEQFAAKVQNDRNFLLSLAEQHHVSVVEIERYIQQVLDDLQKKGQFEIEKLQNWQLVERDYIKTLIAEYKNGLSTAEFEQKLREDRAHLNQLADQYRVNVEQIEEWMISELKRLRGNTETSLRSLSAWQVSELERLQNLLKEQTHISYVEFEMELQKERERLRQLGHQYSVNVEEIEQWLRQQLINLKTTGNAKVEKLAKWQIEEQERLIELLLKHQQDMNYEDVERELSKDRAHLESLSQTNHVSIEQVDNWLHDELRRLQDSGLVQFEKQTQWQKQISNGFNNWLKQQQDSATYQEFMDFLKRDKSRLNGIANDYHLTVEQVEQWVQKETARLSLIGVIEKPQDNFRYEEIISITDQSANSQPWKEYVTARLRSEAHLKPMTWQEFRMYLVRNKPNFERLAQQYHITVEEIHLWLEESARQLADEGLITGTVTVEEWQLKEQQHIQDLINQQLRRRQKWTIEELQLKLLNDQKHLLDVVRQYQITIEELKLWYKNELKRLLDLRKIERGYGLSWQTKELERIYQTVVRHPINRNALEQLLLRDVAILAPQYRVTVEELRIFIHEKLQRLADMGLIVDSTVVGNDWKEQERQRLRQIGSSVIITDGELLQLLASDTNYQQELARLYGVGLEQLAPIQSIYVGNMAKEHLLEQRNLIVLAPWQQKERDRLYGFIGTQNMTLRQLRDWQRQSEETRREVKEWQLKEFERIMAVARYYGISLIELQQFREEELQYLTYLNHRKLLPESEVQNWESKQHWRLQKLQTKYKKYGQDLSIWRRTLYLLSQGLISLPGGNAGYIIDSGTTNATAVQKPIFSKDRGDQPPHIYEEAYNEDDEPGLEGETKAPRPLPIVSTPPPLPYHRQVPSNANIGYDYRRTDYTFNVPVGSVAASATGGADGSSASASASLGKWSRAAGDEPISQQQVQIEDLGQQQQEDLGWNDGQVDGGQQQQEQELAWNSNYQLGSDAGQTQQQLLDDKDDLGQRQVEDLTGKAYGHSYGSNYGQLQQAQPTETTPKPSTFENFKNKITGIFG
ncbi:PREDICTED: tiggrin isoform X1 [Drosophila arizonae]|uniref:Tiggrin isoform X1 n=1 Tax=Drosophila arizonae TaxID=7263 RepID=A0ABM1NWJ9_DROAR|nr:PREDICTED: tiggrin isoform X1 [Drosophila arizonae]XP_017859335.1 PREDICTED: tiggrin isoform X1 [Drosophila arizonae]